MGDQQEYAIRKSRPPCIKPPRSKAKTSSPLLRYVPFLILLAAISAIAGFQVARFKGAWMKLQNASSAQAASISASPAPMSGAMDEELSRLAPQQQAERLLVRAIHRQQGSLELIRQNVDGWRGRLQNTNRLFDLVRTALNSDDLRVRSAAVEIDLAAHNLNKSSQSIALLMQQLREDPAGRPGALWRLGALGNRGVEPQTVLATLLAYARDPNEQTRYAAVEGLAMLGSEAVIDPLLDRLAHDPSPRVRQRAGCSLAQAGMLTKEQRLDAVPDLLNFLDDDSLDSATRSLAYGALRQITGAELGNNAHAWRRWWAHQDSARKQSSHTTGILRA